jgi:PAS domain S-box-containing protein
MSNPQPPSLPRTGRAGASERRAIRNGDPPRAHRPAAQADNPAQLRHALSERTAELADAFALMHATLEAAADGIVVADAEGRITAFNEKFLRLSGMARSELESAPIARLRAQAPALFVDTPRHAAHWTVASGPDSTTGLVELADGRVLERHACMQQVDDHPAGWVWSFRDVTSHRRAEEALREEAGVLGFLNDTGATTAAMLDVPSLMQTVIDAATNVSGASFGAFFYRDVPVRAGAGAVDDPGLAPAAHGTPMIAFSGVARSRREVFDPAAIAEAFGAAWHADHPVRCADVSLLPAPEDHPLPRRKPGSAEPAIRSFLAVPVTLRCGTTVGGLFLGHPEADVFTERSQRIVEGVAAHAAIALDNARLVDGMRRAADERERLVEAERSARAESVRAARIKDDFLATLSHELRTPLTAILGWANVLLLGRADAATEARGLEAIVRNANTQVELIEDLLEMSRIVSGKVRLEVRPTDLVQVIDAALATAHPAAEAKAITVVRRVDANPCRVMGDPARLQQLLWNLLSNAVKFTPRQGRVEIAFEAAADEVSMTVIDTGPGIDPAFLPHVFEQFRQADASTTRRHGGLGLGLAIVKQLATLHGGTVSAHNEGPGRGARFVVHLPCGDMPRAQASETRVPATRSDAPPDAFQVVDLGGLDLLVVDDQPDARELVAQLLVECGATVRQAESAAEAIREFAAQPPDVLLSDIGMPGRDGYELIREIRRLPAGEGAQVPALALTAFTRPHDRARALKAGYQAHLSKPIQPHDLVATVARLAGRAAATRAEPADAVRPGA